jgi:hypothetical protein
MDEVFRDYWWLMFPIGAFLFGAWDRWLAYRRSRDHLDLIRSYAEQGKEPPAELLRGVNGDPMDGFDPGHPGSPPGYPLGYAGYGMSPRHMRRAYRHYYRWGPYAQWRGVFITGAIAAGFWWASGYSDFPGIDGGLRIVAIILTCVTAANLLVAILYSSFRGK